MKTASQELRNLFEVGATGGLPDGQLLERFLASGDKTAFEVLLRRHGPMVWGVCRRTLPDYHDAEDAFQAAFLVLARKAAAIAPREAVAGWLYGVAIKTAMKAKAISARRRSREVPMAHDPEMGPDSRESLRHLMPLLDQELRRLPERYRTAIVLCELEGLTRREAAVELGCAEGTLASRLARGRSLLADRLRRRVSTNHEMLDATLLLRASAPVAELPGVLISSTARAASAMIGRVSIVAGVSQLHNSSPGAAGGLALKQACITMALIVFGIAGIGLTYFANVSSPPATGSELGGEVPTGGIAEERVRAEARLVLDRAKASVREVADLEERVWLLCEIARVQGRAGLDDAINDTLKLAFAAGWDTESEQRIVDVAEAFARAGSARDALELVKSLTINRDNGLGRIAASLAKAGDESGAMGVAEAVREEPYRGEAFARIAMSQAERGNVKGALGTLSATSSDNSLAMALAAIAARQHRDGDPAAAATLDRARQCAKRIPLFFGGSRTPSDQRPSVLAEIAGTLAITGAVEEARKVAGEITKAPWDDIARRRIVTALVDRGEIETALQVADHVRGAVEKANALEEIVEARIRADDLAGARTLANAITPGFWRIQAQLSVAKRDYLSGHREEAGKIFDTILQEAGRPQDQANIGNITPAALARLGRAQGELGESAAALAWINKRTDPLVKAWAMIGLAEGMAGRLPVPPLPAPGDAAPGSMGIKPPTASPIVGAGPITSFRGKIVLFGSQRVDDLQTARIEMIQPDGTGLETVLALDQGYWITAGRVSPDGSRLAYSVAKGKEERAELWLVGTDRVRRKLAGDFNVVAWSPDGRSLAGFRVLSKEKREFENVLIDVVTGRERRLSIPASDVVEDWSLDGETLAVMATNEGRVFQHPTKGTYPLRQIYLVKTDGTGRETLTASGMLDCLDARFSPDGTQLTYFQRRHPDGQVLHFAVVQDRGGAEIRELGQFDAIYAGNRQYKPNGPPCWSNDGKTVAWFIPRRKTESSTTRIEILLMSLEKDQPQRLDLSGLGMTWVQAIDWR